MGGTAVYLLKMVQGAIDEFMSQARPNKWGSSRWQQMGPIPFTRKSKIQRYEYRIRQVATTMAPKDPRPWAPPASWGGVHGPFGYDHVASSLGNA